MKAYRWALVGLLGVLLIGILGELSFAVEGMSPVRAQTVLQKYRWLLDSPVRAYLSGGAQNFFHVLEQIAQGKKFTPLDVRVNNPSTDLPPIFTQSEPTIAAKPGTQIACAAWNDSYSSIDPGNSLTGFARTEDGGATWSDQGAMPSPGDGFINFDPVLAYRSASEEFIFSGAAESVIEVAFSGDDCETFNAITALEGLDPDGFQDKPWLAVDNTGGAFDGHIYVCWTEFMNKVPSSTRILFSVSTDGGLSWSPPISLSPGNQAVQGCNIAVGPNGEVYVAWERYTGSSTAEIRISRSDNGGATFALSNVLVASLNQLGNTRATCGRRVLKGDIRVNEFPSLAVNQLNSHVYVAYNSRTARDSADVWLARSTNNGANWSSVKVNDDKTTRDQFFPVVRWANPDPDNFPNGVVKVIFYDRRLDSANYRIDLFAAESVNSGVSFLPNMRVTDVSFLPPRINPNIDPILRACYMGDYNDMVAADLDDDEQHDVFYIVWGDNRDITTLPTTRQRTPDPNVYFDTQPLIANCLLDFDPDPTGDDPDLDFGFVLVRGTSQLAIHLTNIGGRDCRVTRVLSSKGVFRFVGATDGVQPTTTRLPQVIPPGGSLALIIEAKPTRADFGVTGNITVTTNDPVTPRAVFGVQVFGVAALSPLGLRALELKRHISSWELNVLGENIAAVRLEIFELRGRKVFEEEALGTSLRFHGLTPRGRPLANGVYLYVVTVRGYDGTVIRREAKKLVLLR